MMIKKEMMVQIAFLTKAIIHQLAYNNLFFDTVDMKASNSWR